MIGAGLRVTPAARLAASRRPTSAGASQSLSSPRCAALARRDSRASRATTGSGGEIAGGLAAGAETGAARAGSNVGGLRAARATSCGVGPAARRATTGVAFGGDGDTSAGGVAVTARLTGSTVRRWGVAAGSSAIAGGSTTGAGAGSGAAATACASDTGSGRGASAAGGSGAAAGAGSGSGAVGISATGGASTAGGRTGAASVTGSSATGDGASVVGSAGGEESGTSGGGSGTGVGVRAGSRPSGSTYPSESAATRTPRWTCDCEVTASTLAPTVPTTAPSSITLPRRALVAPSCRSVTAYPSAVWIVTARPPPGTKPTNDTVPAAGARTASPTPAAMSTPRCWPPA